MCVAIPMEILSVDGDLARVSSGGAQVAISLALVDGARVGDFVIVHSGHAIQVLPPREAHERLEILRRLAE
jgi:hydrogenase expression/formation protein HypC